MSLKLAKIAVTIAAGASTGTANASPMPTGYIEEIYLDYAQTSAVSNVTIIEAGHSQPILAVTNNQTDGAYYPRIAAVNPANVTFGSDGAVPIAVVSPLTVSITGGNIAAPAVTAYIKVRTL